MDKFIRSPKLFATMDPILLLDIIQIIIEDIIMP